MEHTWTFPVKIKFFPGHGGINLHTGFQEVQGAKIKNFRKNQVSMKRRFEPAGIVIFTSKTVTDGLFQNKP
jgi:hypothetical protein